MSGNGCWICLNNAIDFFIVQDHNENSIKTLSQLCVRKIPFAPNICFHERTKRMFWVNPTARSPGCLRTILHVLVNHRHQHSRGTKARKWPWLPGSRQRTLFINCRWHVPSRIFTITYTKDIEAKDMQKTSHVQVTASVAPMLVFLQRCHVFLVETSPERYRLSGRGSD